MADCLPRPAAPPPLRRCPGQYSCAPSFTQRLDEFRFNESHAVRHFRGRAIGDVGWHGNTVLPVSLFVARARLLIERNLGVAWVGGEISNFTRAASGHCYFNLKDAQAQVRCVLFRQRAQHVDFALRDGLAVEVRAGATIYEARGEFQLNVDSVRLAGVGALYEQFARLKARLAAAGWFAPERKRALPDFPRAIGIVTSPRAAALRDVLATLARRWPARR